MNSNAAGIGFAVSPMKSRLVPRTSSAPMAIMASSAKPDARPHHRFTRISQRATAYRSLATGGLRQTIHQVLDHLGIRQLFDTIVTSEDVSRQKPAPDIFLEAARRLGVPPEFCRAYEDTDLGLKAIRAAGMQAVDVRRIIKPHSVA